MPITFYPGPSKVYPQVAGYMQEAYEQGILSINHRSSLFMDICQKAIQLMKEKLQIPQAYTIMFVSSATESWEIIAQSLIEKGSFHLYNGAFGQKWFEYTQKLHPQAQGYAFGVDDIIQIDEVNMAPGTEVLCFTQNETSNGTQVSNDTIRLFRKQYPEVLLAIDATSSLGGVELDFNQADIWYASVQKCLGLPAGLGVLICSPAAIVRARQLNENAHYNSLLFIYDNIVKYQTQYTPNVLNIYLLMRVMEQVQGIHEVHKETSWRARNWYTFFESMSGFSPLVKNKEVRSDTVVAVKGEPAAVQMVKEKAKQAEITLGNGYGEWKASTFRVANFPAIMREEIETAQQLLSSLPV